MRNKLYFAGFWFMLILLSCSNNTPTTTLPDGETPDPVNLLSGKIVYGLQNNDYFFTINPLFGATVTLIPTNKSVVTGVNGSYSFSDLQPGYYTIEVSKSTYETKRVQIQITNASNKVQDVYLKSQVIDIPKWYSYPLGANGGAVSFGGDGIYVSSKGADEVYAYLNLKVKNNQNYEFSCDVMKDIASIRAGFFIKRSYLDQNQEYGEYWNIDSWHNSTYNLLIFNPEIIDSQLVWQDSILIDTTYTYSDSVSISLLLKAEGGTTQGMFNHIKVQKK